MKNEFILAFNEVLEEKRLPKEIILEALEAAMVSAYRRAVNASNAQDVKAKIDPETGKVSIYAEKEVVEVVENSHTETTVAEACAHNPDVKIGDVFEKSLRRGKDVICATAMIGRPVNPQDIAQEFFIISR